MKVVREFTSVKGLKVQLILVETQGLENRFVMVNAQRDPELDKLYFNDHPNDQKANDDAWEAAVRDFVDDWWTFTGRLP